MTARAHPVGNLCLMLPQEQDHDRDWLAIVIPAWKGSVTVTVHINFAHIEGTLTGLLDEEDVKAFLEAHRPWRSTFYDLW